MFDLSKPFGTLEGLVVYGDHQRQDLAYVLPDEIDLRELAANAPDIALQIYFPDEAVAAGDLAQAVGAILSVGVRCLVAPDRLERARDAAREASGRDDLELAIPPWEDGSVELLLLDTQSGAEVVSAVRDDRLVRGVVGSRKPSLSDGLLSAIFHARLDRRGTALCAAALEGKVGSLAGVLYDLKFLAMRPAVDLRMSADLNRCAEFFRVGAGVQVYYVGADISATFGQMREQGVIKVDLVSQAGDPEAEKLVNECVRDFYDVLMRELFKPTVPPVEALGAGMGSVQTSLVKFSFAYSKVEQERVVEVDYRKRSATRRTHNPQAHLARLATLAAGHDVIQRVPLSAGWREHEVEIAAPDAFKDANLRQARVVIWRGRDPVLEPAQAREGGLRMPATAVPLADLAFTATDSAVRRLAWVNEPTEAPFYRWQARFTYAPEGTVDSPSEIWSAPRTSSSSDLDLFPEVLAPKRTLALKLGDGHDETLSAIEAAVTARDDQGKELARTRLTVRTDKPEAHWAVRRPEGQPVLLEAGITYRYGGNRTITRASQALIDREIFANVPFMRTVTLSPLVFGAPPNIVEVILIATYEHAASGYRDERILRLRPPDFRGEDLRVPVLGAADDVAWRAMAVNANGDTVDIGQGRMATGPLNLRISRDRRIRVEWLGPSPAALSLRWARALFRAKAEDGTTLGEATLEWRGDNVEGERLVTLPNEGRAEWALEKRFEDGRRETSAYQPVDGDLIGVVAG
ncbi:MAG: hypothetical protein AB7F99_17925 [Vicinamibacterales bacterium]